MAIAKKRGGLTARYNHSMQTKDNGAGNPALNWRKVPREVKFMKPKEGKNRINIIPYEIKTKNHPLVKSGDMKIGDYDYVMDYYVHRGVGPAQADIVCLKRNYGKPCPVCEAADDLKQKGKQKEFDALRASRRVVYNVLDLKTGELMVLEASHFLFEKELIEEARASSDDSNIIDFADPENGKTIVFRASSASFGGHEYFEYKSFQFVDREEEIEDEILDSAISFDEILQIKTYDQIERILFGKDEEEETEEEEDKAPPARNLDDEDEEEERPVKAKSASKPAAKPAKKPVVEEEEEEERPAKKAKKPVVEEDDDDEPPFVPDKKATKPAKSSKVEVEIMTEEEVEDHKAKVNMAKKKKEDETCPYEHTFGTDCDEHDECNRCKLWEKCVKAQ